METTSAATRLSIKGVVAGVAVEEIQAIESASTLEEQQAVDYHFLSTRCHYSILFRQEDSSNNSFNIRIHLLVYDLSIGLIRFFVRRVEVVDEGPALGYCYFDFFVNFV